MNRLERTELRHPDGRRVLVYGSHDADAHVGDAPLDARGIHKRLDLLTHEWVVISPGRNVRPLDSVAAADATACPVCPGGAELPFSFDAAAFENRFPSLMADPPQPSEDGLIAGAYGRCEVVVYTARHDTSFGALSADEAARVLAIWTDRSSELWQEPGHEFVLVFENRGADAGATLAHPHGQIYAFDQLPPRQATRAEAERRYREEQGTCLGCALVANAAERDVASNDNFAVAVPFAPRWPYEVAVRARRHGLRRLADLTATEQVDLINALRDVALRLDLLFGTQMPYLMACQEAPRNQPDWHMAFEFYPLRRSKDATKIRASVETATGIFLTDVRPEAAAARLKGLLPSVDRVAQHQLVAVDAGRRLP